jgi:hypothetical protein
MGILKKKTSVDEREMELSLKFYRDPATYKKLGLPQLTPTPKRAKRKESRRIDYARDR